MDFTLMKRGVKVIARDICDKEAFKEKRFSFRKLLMGYYKQNPLLSDLLN